MFRWCSHCAAKADGREKQEDYQLGDGGGGDEILEWDATNKVWKEIGKMKESRHAHGMSVVDLSDVINDCT